MSDGHPDLQGYWTSRFNAAVFDVEDHPVARPGIPPGKGAIVDPPDGRPHIRPEIKLFEGDSVGRWEGDTLVIDTTNQNGRGWFDMMGNFTTPNIHVIERFTPVDTNTINVGATIEDPTICTRPWKVAGTFGRRLDPNYEQLEFACLEGNDDLQHYVESEGGKAKSRK